MIELLTLTRTDRFIYAITEKIYRRQYFCAGCDCDFWVKGAFPNRDYFCNDCGTELLKTKVFARGNK